MKISVAEAKNRLPELIRAVEAGEPVTIYRRGVPIVDLVPTKVAQSDKPKFGTLSGRVQINDPNWWHPMSDEEADEFLRGDP